MHPYIPHLLEDIKNAHRYDCSDSRQESKMTFEEEMEEVEKWATGIDIPPTLGHQCNLSFEQFPPVEMLTEDEMKIIIYALHEMLSTWNMEADIPSEVPTSRAYPLIISLLKEEAWYLPGGTLHFDFCDGYAPDCELKEYCPCLEYWKDDKREM